MNRHFKFISLVFLFFLIITSVLPVCASPNPPVDPMDDTDVFSQIRPQYTLTIDLSSATWSAAVREVVSVTNTTGETWDSIVFSMPPATYPRVFRLDSVIVEHQHTTIPAQAGIDGSMLTVALPVAVAPRESVVVMLTFRLFLRELTDADAYPGGNLGHNDSVMQFGDFYPVVTPYDPGEGFRTWEYVPSGDPFVYLVSDCRVSITTDADMLIAAYGLITHDDRLWQFNLPNIRSFAFCASEYYDFISGSAGDIPVYVYYVRGFEHAAEVILKTAEQTVELYARLFGPYHYKEIVLGQNAYIGSMEYSGFVTISNTYIKNFTDATPQLLLFVVVHELGHQWWYSAVGNDQTTEAWLDEGLTRFSEYFYFREYRPDLLEWWQTMMASEPLSDHFIDDPLSAYKDEPRAYTRMTYNVTPAFFQELYELVGEMRFLAFLKDYYSNGTDRFVTGRDFFKVLGEHTTANITPLVQKYFRHAP